MPFVNKKIFIVIIFLAIIAGLLFAIKTTTGKENVRAGKPSLLCNSGVLNCNHQGVPKGVCSPGGKCS